MIELGMLTKYSAKIFQTALNDHGAKPKLIVDGIPGRKTLKAFVDFQFDYKISWTDDLTESLESLGLKATVTKNYVSLKKSKRNIKVEPDRPKETLPPEDYEDNDITPGQIKIPTKRSECFQNKLWIDGAKKGPNVNAKGGYRTSTGRCIGAVIHHTAGWNKPGSIVGTLRRTKYGFNGIDYSLGVYQAGNLPLNKFGYHAGTSAAFLVGYGKTKSCSDKLVGYEISGGGLLKKGVKSKGQNPNEYYTWFGKKVPKSQRRYLEKDTLDWGPKGWYEKFSASQVKHVEDVLVWHCLNDKSFKWQNIYAHHEVSGKKFIGRWRKNDPGGSMPYDMEALRQRVRRRVEKVLNK